MSETQIRQRLLLKSLARRRLQGEVKDLRFLLVLQRMDGQLRKRLGQRFDPISALQLNAVEFLASSMSSEESYPPKPVSTKENIKTEAQANG